MRYFIVLALCSTLGIGGILAWHFRARTLDTTTSPVEETRDPIKRGHAVEYFNLDEKYAKGDGVPEDYAQAVTWSRKAAEQGDTAALYSLALNLFSGQDVPQDYSQAAALFREAAEQGNKDAQKLTWRDVCLQTRRATGLFPSLYVD